MQLARLTTPPAKLSEVLFLGFNQDSSCMIIGTNLGFSIFNSDPFKENSRTNFIGGISYVEMLFRTNILAVIGCGSNPKYPATKVMIWDDSANRCIGELSFRSEVKAVKLRRDFVSVVLDSMVYFYNFSDLRLLGKIETISNPRGLCCLSSSSTPCVMACPGTQPGHVRVELYTEKRTILIEAHDTKLSCISLNADGTRLATASETGTLIRIFDTSKNVALQELRRGSAKAEIYSLVFNPGSTYLACTSSSGTVHVFNLSDVKVESGANQTSSLSFLGGYLPYFASEWSCTQKFISYSNPAMAAFVDESCLLVITASGEYCKYRFDPKDSKKEWIVESDGSFANKEEDKDIALP